MDRAVKWRRLFLGVVFDNVRWRDQSEPWNDDDGFLWARDGSSEKASMADSVWMSWDNSSNPANRPANAVCQ